MIQEEFKNRYQYNPATDKLGEGGLGSVFKAYDTHRDCWVALKISKVNPDYASSRLKKAVETATQLSSHPNIACYDDCYTLTSFDGEYDFGIQQYYEEGNLSQLLKKGGLSLVQKQGILTQILSGIEFLHNHDIIHYNLKPQNILIVKRGEEYVPKITDFGCSVTVSGTPVYASPEQLGERATSKNTDFWSFSVIAYQMLIGELPFTSREHAITSEAGRLELFRQINSGQLPATINNIAEPWQQLIRACLVPDSEKRVKDCKECIAVLNGETQVDIKQKDAIPKIQDEDTTLEIPKPQPELELPLKPKSKPKSVKRLIVVIACGIAVLLLALFITGKLSSTSDEEFIRIELNGKYGFRDKTGRQIIPCKYDYAGSFSEGCVSVKLNNKWGYIDKTDSEIIPLKYDYAGSFSEGLAPVRLKNKYGYINKTDKEIIPLKYDYAMSFSEGLAVIVNSKEIIPNRDDGTISIFERNCKFGFIDKTGKEVIPCKYSYALKFSEGLASVDLVGQCGYIDKTGKEVIPCKYSFPWSLSSFSEGLACIFNGKYGFIDKTGKEIISCKYDDAWPFSKGLACVKLNGKFGFIDKTGKEIVPCIYDAIRASISMQDNIFARIPNLDPQIDHLGSQIFFPEGLACVKLNGKFGFIDKTGKEIVPCKYDATDEFYEGFARVVVKSDDEYKWGFMDKTGKEVIPCKYDITRSFAEGLACVAFNGKYGFIDKTGKEIIPRKYDGAWSFAEGLACVKLNDKYGFINKTGREVISLKYDYAESFNQNLQGLALVVLNEKGHYIDTNETRWKYDEVGPFSGMLAPVKLNDKWGYMDKTGKEIVLCKYDYVGAFSEGLAIVLLNWKFGFMDETGREIIPCKYDDIMEPLEPFSNGLAVVALNGRWFYIDKAGKYVKDY